MKKMPLLFALICMISTTLASEIVDDRLSVEFEVKDNNLVVEVWNTSDRVIKVSNRLVIGLIVGSADIEMRVLDNNGTPVYMNGIVDVSRPSDSDLIALSPRSFFGTSFDMCSNMFPFSLERGTYDVSLRYRARAIDLGERQEISLVAPSRKISIKQSCQ